MATFQKLSNGNILYTDNSSNLHAFSATMNILPHPTKSNLIIITDDANNIEFDKGTIVDVSLVTTPTNTGRNDLITQLASTFFFKSLDFAKLQSDPTDKAVLVFNSETGLIESDQLVAVFAKLNQTLTDGALLKYNATTKLLESASSESTQSIENTIVKRDASKNIYANDFILS